MLGSIHVRNARLRVAFSSRSSCEVLQNNGKILSKQITPDESNDLTSSIPSGDCTFTDNLCGPNPVSKIPSREFLDAASKWRPTDQA